MDIKLNAIHTDVNSGLEGFKGIIWEVLGKATVGYV
jgi:hypothetical protein